MITEHEQVRKAKMRLRMLRHCQQISHNGSLTCRFFGVSRNQLYIWRRRFQREGKEGSAGPVPQTPNESAIEFRQKWSL